MLVYTYGEKDDHDESWEKKVFDGKNHHKSLRGIFRPTNEGVTWISI